MPTLTLCALTTSDHDELTAFEFRNREFFESWINARPEAYYAPGGIAAAIAAAQQDASRDLAYQYLLREDGTLVARVNLTQVKRAHYHCASLGYRVGAEHNGRGLAKAAVRLARDQAFSALSLHRIEATCRPENPASIHVLAANGFVQFGHARRCFQLGGSWFDLLHFEAHAQTI
ncbi:MAG: GNAT family N-acetyltransferase [Burkholderiaceae bacterium]|nr:GNAT family N-acetyltransferase [Burkholderiaceae bacterium]